MDHHWRSELDLIRDELVWAGQPRLAKMTALLHVFRGEDQAAVSEDAVRSALRDAGLIDRDALPGRDQVLVLRVASDQVRASATGVRELPSGASHSVARGPLWLDVSESCSVAELKAALVDALHPPPDHVLAALLADETCVVTPDGPAAIAYHRIEAVLATPTDEAHADVVRPAVRILAGADWVITRTSEGSARFPLLMRPVASRVSQQIHTTSGDLALQIVRIITDTFDAATRSLMTRVGQLEELLLGRIASVDDQDEERDGIERDMLRRLSRLLQEVGLSASALRTVQAARMQDYQRTWFPNVSGFVDRKDPPTAVRDLDHQLSARLEHLAEIQARTIGLLDLAQAHFDSVRARRNDRLDTVVTKVTAVVLVPGLIASIFGANVRLVGQESWASTMLLFALMFVGGILTFVVMRGPRPR